jgi:hypothetical protein
MPFDLVHPAGSAAIFPLGERPRNFIRASFLRCGHAA